MEHHKRAEFLEKYLDLVNCDMSDGDGLLRDMSRHFNVVTDRDAYNSLKEWHEVSHFSINQFARFFYEIYPGFKRMYRSKAIYHRGHRTWRTPKDQLLAACGGLGSSDENRSHQDRKNTPQLPRNSKSGKDLFKILMVVWLHSSCFRTINVTHCPGRGRVGPRLPVK